MELAKQRKQQSKPTLTPEQANRVKEFDDQVDLEHKIFCRYVDALTTISNLSMDDDKLKIFCNKVLENDSDYLDIQLQKIGWGMQNLQKIKAALTKGVVRNNNLKAVK